VSGVHKFFKKGASTQPSRALLAVGVLGHCPTDPILLRYRMDTDIPEQDVSTNHPEV